MSMRHEVLGISLTGRLAQSADDLALATGRNRSARGRVAVTPKLPAVPVVADSVTEFTPRMYFPADAAGMKPLRGCMNDARRVAASEIAVRLPVVPSL